MIFKSNNTIILLGLLCSLSLFGQTLEEEPYIRAQEKIYDGVLYICRGDAELFWKDYHIFADEITYDTREKIVSASGRVAFNDKDSVISGDSFVMDLKTHQGDLNNVFGLAPPTVSFKTEHLHQVDQETFKFDKLTFSSCAQLHPDWNLLSHKGTIKKNRYIDMTHVVFKINLFGGLPVFYLPYLRYPLQKDGRSTGFLFPQFGQSPMRGWYFNSAFYWDMAPNMDLTAKLDWFAKVGVGIGGELRYLFRGGTQGTVNYYQVLHRADSLFMRKLADGTLPATIISWKPFTISG